MGCNNTLKEYQVKTIIVNEIPYMIVKPMDHMLNSSMIKDILKDHRMFGVNMNTIEFGVIPNPKKEIKTCFYLRDDNSFRQLSKVPKTALAQIKYEYDRGYKFGTLLCKEVDSVVHCHGDWNQFELVAQDMLIQILQVELGRQEK